MKHFTKRAISLLCTLALITSCHAALAAGPEARTVHAEVWDEWMIYVNDTPLCIADEYDRYQWPLRHEGSFYIPLQTASELLGAEFTWDKARNTITLTRTGAPYYRHYVLEQPDEAWTEERSEQVERDWKYGVELELRPDIKVYLDGETLAWLRRIDGYVEKFAALPRPETPFIDVVYGAVVNHARGIRFYGAEPFISFLENGLSTANNGVIEFHFADIKDEPGSIVQCLGWIYSDIARGQRILDAVRAQTGY